MKRPKGAEEPESENDSEEVPLERLPAPSKKPNKLKYQEKGFRIEISIRDGAWKLLKYYRSEADMRKAYLALGRDSRSYVDPHAFHRMVFPDGAILPRTHDPAHPSYWEKRRLFGD